jgi:ABC-type branched-subunit amino acid transport system ATPase component
MTPILSVSNVSLTLGGQRILQHVSVAVQPGEVVGLIGPNGSGKTTFFNVLSGFLKPSSGSIHFRDADITAYSPSQRARIGIGRVFQNFGVFRDMTLEENVLVALEALPADERMALGSLHDRVRDTLKMVKLQDHARKKASSLSGGQLRLLEIARTFASQKQVFLLDEPTAGVSPKMTGEVSELIRRLKQEGRTVLIVEHDLPFIRSICDRIVVLDVGQVVLEGRPEEIHSSKKLKEIYFGADPVT